jgi:hypothetical protein
VSYYSIALGTEISSPARKGVVPAVMYLSQDVGVYCNNFRLFSPKNGADYSGDKINIAAKYHGKVMDNR